MICQVLPFLNNGCVIPSYPRCPPCYQNFTHCPPNPCNVPLILVAEIPQAANLDLENRGAITSPPVASPLLQPQIGNNQVVSPQTNYSFTGTLPPPIGSSTPQSIKDNQLSLKPPMAVVQKSMIPPQQLSGNPPAIEIQHQQGIAPALGDQHPQINQVAPPQTNYSFTGTLPPPIGSSTPQSLKPVPQLPYRDLPAIEIHHQEVAPDLNQQPQIVNNQIAPAQTIYSFTSKLPPPVGSSTPLSHRNNQPNQINKPNTQKNEEFFSLTNSTNQHSSKFNATQFSQKLREFLDQPMPPLIPIIPTDDFFKDIVFKNEDKMEELKNAYQKYVEELQNLNKILKGIEADKKQIMDVKKLNWREDSKHRKMLQKLVDECTEKQQELKLAAANFEKFKTQFHGQLKEGIRDTSSPDKGDKEGHYKQEDLAKLSQCGKAFLNIPSKQIREINPSLKLNDLSEPEMIALKTAAKELEEWQKATKVLNIICDLWDENLQAIAKLRANPNWRTDAKHQKLMDVHISKSFMLWENLGPLVQKCKFLSQKFLDKFWKTLAPYIAELKKMQEAEKARQQNVAQNQNNGDQNISLQKQQIAELSKKEEEERRGLKESMKTFFDNRRNSAQKSLLQ